MLEPAIGHTLCVAQNINQFLIRVRRKKFKTGNGCNGCARESSSQLRGVFMSCAGIANFHVVARSNVGKALFGSVQISADPESAYTQIRPTNVP